MKKAVLFTLCVCCLLNVSNNLFAQTTGNKTKPVLNHIAVYVTDLKVSTAFYQNILQLDTIPEPFHDGKHTWFAIGPTGHLHIIQGANEFTAHDKNNHLCFSVASMVEFIKVLDANHIEYENWAGQKMQVTNRVDGVHQVYFKDPDGFWLEINDAKN
jgi:lactoylglutathione lyase